MWFLRGATLPSSSAFDAAPPRIMATKATTKLPMMATNATITRYVICELSDVLSESVDRPALHGQHRASSSLWRRTMRGLDRINAVEEPQ